MVIVALGAVLFIAGLLVYLVRHRYCLRLIRITAGDPDAVTYAETVLNTRYFILRRKLQHLVIAGDDEELRHSAAVALRLGGIFQTLLVLGIVVMAIGASAK
jgi:hypothetical protein